VVFSSDTTSNLQCLSNNLKPAIGLEVAISLEGEEEEEEEEEVTATLPIVLVLLDTTLRQSMVPPADTEKVGIGNPLAGGPETHMEEKTNGLSNFCLTLLGNTYSFLRRHRQYDTAGSQKRNERYESGRRNNEDSVQGAAFVPNIMVFTIH
jgi:hypothetical protein